MINILLIENEVMHFQIIRNALVDYFGNTIKIYPENAIEQDKSLNDLNYLIDKMQSKKFDDVLEYYKQIDLFIVDATLTPRADSNGVNFLLEMRDKVDRNVKGILISGTDEKKQMLHGRNIPFVSKIKHGIQDHFTTVLIDEIVKLFPTLSKRKKEAVRFKAKNETGDVKNSEQNANRDSPDYETFTPTPAFGANRKRYGLHFALHMVWIKFVSRFERRVIDKMMLILFYTLIVLTICFGGYNVIRDIFSSFGNHEETQVLKTAEQIFLNLLPINIVFGFLNYYKTNIRISLLEEGNMYSVDHDKSTRAMNLTKKLFVSSIISYVIIKMIELLFINENVDLKLLIPGGCLLALLMIYFIFLDRKNH